MSAIECARCKAPAGRWVVRRRLDPLNPADMICLGTVDPGPDWWGLVTRWWDVSDAPLPRWWIPPELIQLRPPGGDAKAPPLCKFCRPADARAEQPSLFDEIQETES